MEDHEMNEMTTRDFIRVLFQQKVTIFLTISIIAAIAVTGALLKTPLYESEVKMLISGKKQAQAEYYTDIGISGIRIAQITLTQSEIVSSDPVLERAVSVLGLAQKPLDYEKRFCSPLKKLLVDWRVRGIKKQLSKFTEEQVKSYRFRLAMENLRQRLTVEPLRDTDLFLIKVRDYDPIGAALTANVVSRSYVIFDLEQQLAEMQLRFGEKNLAVVQLKEAIEKMGQALNGAPLPPIKAMGPATVKIIEQAKVPLKASGISRVLIVLIGVFIGVVLAVLLAFGLEFGDHTFKTPQETAAFLDLAYLGSLPKRAGRRKLFKLAEQLYYEITSRDAKSVLLTSARRREGVSFIVEGLGRYAAEHMQKKVLLIDGNFRDPVLHRRFRLLGAEDLVDVLEGHQSLEKAVTEISPKLHVLPSRSLPGHEPSVFKKWFCRLTGGDLPVPASLNPMRAMDSEMMRDLVRQAGRLYDLVLIDSAPLGEAKDTAILSGFSDGVIIVVNERKTRRHVARYALEPLKTRQTNLLGFVLSRRRYVIPRLIYDRV